MSQRNRHHLTSFFVLLLAAFVLQSCAAHVSNIVISDHKEATSTVESSEEGGGGSQTDQSAQQAEPTSANAMQTGGYDEEAVSAAFRSAIQKCRDSGKPVYKFSHESGAVVLTIDAGAARGEAEKTVDLLLQQNVPAVFFFTGLWAKQNPDVVGEVAAHPELFELGNHSYSHKNFVSGGLVGDEQRQEALRAQEVIEQISPGVRVRYFRFPYGAYSAESVRIICDLGYLPVQWTVDSLGWMDGVSKDEVIARIEQKTTAGSVILMHVGSRADYDALPEVLKIIAGKGLQFRRLSELVIAQVQE